MARFSIECGWCGNNVRLSQPKLFLGNRLQNVHCPECGSSVVFRKLDWQKVDQVFPDGIEYCGIHDAAIEQGGQSSEE